MKSLSILLTIALVFCSAVLVSAQNSCSPITTPIGVIPLDNPGELSGFFIDLHQIGTGGADFTWQMSLCDPNNAPAPYGKLCPGGAFLAESARRVSQTCQVTLPTLQSLGWNERINAVTFTYTGSQPGENFDAIVHCTCGNGPLTVPSSSYTAIIEPNSNNVYFTFNVSSAACCPKGITAPPPSNNVCQPVSTPNGVISLSNYKALAGFYPAMKQEGIAPGVYPMSLSLCNPLYSKESVICDGESFIFQGNAAQGLCDLTFDSFDGVTWSETDQALYFKYDSIKAGHIINASVRCACGSSTDSLYSASNSYTASMQPDGYRILLSFNVSSSACCPSFGVVKKKRYSKFN